MNGGDIMSVQAQALFQHKELIAKLTRLLKESRTGDCYCSMGIGDPSCHTHTIHCKEVTELLKELEE